MTSISNSICLVFIKDKYENTLICPTFVIFTTRTNITSDLSCICPKAKYDQIHYFTQCTVKRSYMDNNLHLAGGNMLGYFSADSIRSKKRTISLLIEEYHWDISQF